MEPQEAKFEWHQAGGPRVAKRTGSLALDCALNLQVTRANLPSKTCVPSCKIRVEGSCFPNKEVSLPTHAGLSSEDFLAAESGRCLCWRAQVAFSAAVGGITVLVVVVYLVTEGERRCGDMGQSPAPTPMSEERLGAWVWEGGDQRLARWSRRRLLHSQFFHL